MLFCQICDCEFKKKVHRGQLISLQLRIHEYWLTILCENDTKFVSICWGLLLENFIAISRSFDKSRKLMIL